MKLNHNQLSQHLQRPLLPIYLLSGDEILLLQESLQALREAAKKQGYSTRETYYVEGRFNWDDILISANSLSLFADKKIIELRFRNGKFLEADSKALLQILDFANPDLLIIITMPRLEAGVNRSKAYKAIEDTGATLTLWPIDRQHLPQWIQTRLHHYQIKASADAIEFLADSTEGNLLATQQEIEKLYLLNQQDIIDLPSMMQIVSNSSRYTVFNYVDRCLAGDTANALKTLQGLRDEGHDAILILWGLSRELRILYRLLFAIEQGTPIMQALRNERVADMRHKMVQLALKRLNLSTLKGLLIKAQTIDHCIKGIKKDSPWLHFEQLTLRLCQ